MDLPKSPEYAPAILLKSLLKEGGFDILQLAKPHLFYLCHTFLLREGTEEKIMHRSKQQQDYLPINHEGRHNCRRVQEIIVAGHLQEKSSTSV